MLGPAYAFNCQLSPTVQLHLWKTYNLPVLTSGLAALPIRPVNLKTLISFQNKILRGFLKLSSHSPIPALHFLLGELPIEGKLHLDVFSLFYTIWANPQTTIHQVTRYILRMTGDTSTTWSAHLRLLCRKYKIPDPLYLMEQEPLWSRERWKTLTKTNVIIEHERDLRAKATPNSKMTYLNVQTCSLSGTLHPALQHLLTTQDAKKVRYHIKFLCGDFLTGERLGLDQGVNPQCPLCPAPVETASHILVQCRAMHHVRERLLPELLNAILTADPTCLILVYPASPHLAQFLLDCTSLNLPNHFRLSPQNPSIKEVFKISRDWCHAVAKERSRKIKSQGGKASS